MHQYRSLPPSSNAIFAFCINQTIVTSGFYPVAFFSKCHWGVTSDRNPTKIKRIYMDHLTYIMYEN